MPERLRQSPLFITALIGLALLLILFARGIDYGPLQTDVLIFRTWYRDSGPQGLIDQMFAVNQRHILAGPVVAAGMSIFGENNAPYNALMLISRVFQGVFLTGVIYQLTRQRLFALCAGLALMFSLIRVAELYQQINWFIEPTLTLLLASSYCYLLALRGKSPFWLWYALSIGLYVVSVLIYEAGLPWIAVNFALGWLARDTENLRKRTLLALRDTLPLIITGGIIAVLVLFVFAPWSGLAPDEGGLLARLISELIAALNFPARYANLLTLMQQDNTLPLLLGSMIGAGLLLIALARLLPTENDDADLLRIYAQCGLLALLLIAVSLLVAASGARVVDSYFSRIAFGRIAGLALLSVALIFGFTHLLRLRYAPLIAAVLVGIMIIGPGFTALWTYQATAHATWNSIDDLDNLIQAQRGNYGSPLHLILLTAPDWPGGRFHDAADVVIFELQQKLWQNGADATVDILHVGAYQDEYVNFPGTCEAQWGEDSAGVCLNNDQIEASRWAFDAHPYENVVVVRYDHHQQTLTPIQRVTLAELADYNITTAGRDVLESNPERVLIPFSN